MKMSLLVIRTANIPGWINTCRSVALCVCGRGSLKLILTPTYKNYYKHHCHHNSGLQRCFHTPSLLLLDCYLWGCTGVWKGNKSKYGHYYWHQRLPRVFDVLFHIILALLKGKRMMSLSKHPTGRVITETSTSFYMRIPVDLSAVSVFGEGGGVIYAFRQTSNFEWWNVILFFDMSSRKTRYYHQRRVYIGGQSDGCW